VPRTARARTRSNAFTAQLKLVPDLNRTGFLGCSNFDGRSVRVNGATLACAERPLPSAGDSFCANAGLV
jgi:hypothetical protein